MEHIAKCEDCKHTALASSFPIDAEDRDLDWEYCPECGSHDVNLLKAVSDVSIDDVGSFGYRRHSTGTNCRASFPLYLIRKAWRQGCPFEDLADGFGPGMGTMGGDWSGIRDSSDEAIEKMLERALNFFFGG